MKVVFEGTGVSKNLLQSQMHEPDDRLAKGVLEFLLSAILRLPSGNLVVGPILQPKRGKKLAVRSGKWTIIMRVFPSDRSYTLTMIGPDISEEIYLGTDEMLRLAYKVNPVDVTAQEQVLQTPTKTAPVMVA